MLPHIEGKGDWSIQLNGEHIIPKYYIIFPKKFIGTLVATSIFKQRFIGGKDHCLD
jgi:hypothetical protein